MKDQSKLRILMLCEYFSPFDRGGSEWSSLYLARQLIKKGHHVQVFTPNYGSLPRATKNRLVINRFPFNKKLSPADAAISPYWHTNISWWAKSTWFLFKLIAGENFDILHVQGKYFLPAAIIVGKIKHIPVIVTLRDYQILCPLGFCLWHKRQRCSLVEFFTRDIPTYTEYYQKESSRFLKIISVFLHLRLRFISFLLRLFARHVNQIVFLSQSQRRIFAANGLIRSTVIANSVSGKIKPLKAKKDQVVYLGRLTPGKGAHLLVPIFAAAKLKPQVKLLIIGEGFLTHRIKEQIKEYHQEKAVKLTGRLSHRRALQELERSKVALLPSLWPEPFGRSTLEAIFHACPVVTTTLGGPKEIIQNIFGRTAKPTIPDLSLKLREVLAKSDHFQKNIIKHEASLQQRFVSQPVSQYEKVYARLLKARQP
ncbi:MAG: glycosyltransferase [Candidatus Chisholmbacteria bacterium]|nr:glycosyltransferase [Candidatus Chisholmbacteria bacterium]